MYLFPLLVIAVLFLLLQYFIMDYIFIYINIFLLIGYFISYTMYSIKFIYLLN
jgi:hypothetical protein